MKSPDQYKVHYDGYDSAWDEVVGPSRMRGFGVAAVVTTVARGTTGTATGGAAAHVVAADGAGQPLGAAPFAS